jgi:hypothetical protein
MWTEAKIREEIDKDAYRRMFMEFLLVIYNDILTYQDYIWNMEQWLKFKSQYSRKKLQNHFDSIHWLLYCSKDSICFRFLNLNCLTEKDIIDSILKKFNSNKKFLKFFNSYAIEVGIYDSSKKCSRCSVKLG